VVSPSNVKFINVPMTKTKDGSKELFIFNGTLDRGMILYTRKVVSNKLEITMYAVTAKGAAKSPVADIAKIVTDGFLVKLGKVDDLAASQPKIKK